MTKYLVTCTIESIVFRKVAKGGRPLAIVNDRLYRVDDSLAWRDSTSGDSMVIYNLDDQQPLGNGEYLDPEYTKVLIDSVKVGHGKVGKLSDWSFEKISTIVMVGVIVWAVASQYLGG